MKRKKLLLSDSSIKRRLPLNFNLEDDPYFKKEYEHKLPAVYLFKYFNVNISYAGTIFKGLLNFQESIRNDYRKTLGLRYILYNILRRKKIKSKEKALLIFNNLSECYYHWMTEAIPRLYITRDNLSEYKIILPDTYEKFQPTSLEPFGIKKENIIYISKNTYVNIPELIMPSFTGIEQSYHDNLMKEIRDFYISYYINEPNQILPHEKYYIKRRKTSIRHIINEEEVIKCLHKNGVKDIYFEDFTFSEQISIAFSAKYIISIHGAGLTNMMFMQKNSSILEFRKEKETGYLHYFTLASSLDINYFYLFGQPEDPTISSKEANLLIDIEQLQKTINLMTELS